MLHSFPDQALSHFERLPVPDLPRQIGIHVSCVRINVNRVKRIRVVDKNYMALVSTFAQGSFC